MDLGNILSKLRKNKGLSQRAFANAFGISSGAVAMWETNKRLPDIETLIRLAEFYDVSLEYLLGRSEEKSGFSNKDLTQREKDLITYFHNSCNTPSLTFNDKERLTTFFPYATVLHDEEKELLEYYNELSLKDQRWIMGQMIDLIKKADEKQTQLPKAQ